MPIDRVLYYPTIEFLDETWLKYALCIWDKVYRIVPGDYTPNDSDEVKAAIEQGLVENIKLTRDDLSQTGDLFIKFWDDTPFLPAGLEKYEELEFRLHPEKVDARIRPLFESLARKIDSEGFLNLSAEVAQGYMLFLAETVSRRRDIPKLTDNPDMFAIMHYFTNNGNIDEGVFNDEAQEITTALIVDLILPDGLKHSKINDLIEIRKRNGDALVEFRNMVTQFAAELTKIEDKEFALELINEFKIKLAGNSKKISKVIENYGKGILQSLFIVGVPTTLTAVSTIAGGNPFGATEFIKGGIIGAVSALADAQRAVRGTWENNKSSYYTKLYSKFGSSNSPALRIPDFGRILEEFMND
jgi:hypothetical protein